MLTKNLYKAIQEANAEIEKWEKIGRKPNEFKKGDIVRVIVSGIYEKGTIGIITEVISIDHYRVEATGKKRGNWHFYGGVELVTPVEARFDR
jgi:hypothetical protein